MLGICGTTGCQGTTFWQSVDFVNFVTILRVSWPMPIKAEAASSFSAPINIEAIYAPVADDMARTDKLFEEVLATDNTFVFDMVKYLGQNLGKRVRSALTMLSYRACLGGNVDESAKQYREA